MHGYPKTLRTRADVETLMGYLGTSWATEENKRRGLVFLRGLKDRSQAYFFDRILADGELPDGDEPEYRVMEDEDGERRQLKMQDNPDALIYRLGFTVEEVDQMIAQVEEG